MTKNFSTMGSCASRNIFNSDINENYKSFFTVDHSIERVNMISLMSNPIEYDESLINCEKEYSNICVIEDLSKRYLDSIKEGKFDYIIYDTYFDVDFNIIEIDENTFITDSYSLKETDLYDSFKGKRRISIYKNFDEYFKLYKESCELFFDFFYSNCENTIFILNTARSLYRYLDEGSILENENFKRVSKRDKRYRDILDKYIAENYDVEILPFRKDTLLNKDHIFGFTPTHYEEKYYQEKNLELNNIIKINDLLDYDDEANKEIRNIKRENFLLNIERDDLKGKNDDLTKEMDNLKNVEMKKLKKDYDKLKSKYESLLNSKSWKITKPLRGLKKL